jgi:hypothetical protein
MIRTILGGGSLALLLAAACGVSAEELKPKAGWEVPRTSWGDPDLRGKWPIDNVSTTPSQRPTRFGTRAEMTDEEYDAALASAERSLAQYDREEKAGTIGLGHWTERGRPLRQTSLMTEPANGRMPALTAEGARRAQISPSSFNGPWNWVSDFNTFDRCISRGLPGTMLPGVYNSGIAVWQAPGYVVIQTELIHDTRIIALDGRPAPASPVKAWLGYSRGHWEGDSLVIETSNFRPGSEIGRVDGHPRAVTNSEAMTVKERLTPIDKDTIRYEVWIADPVVLTAPFKLDFPWSRRDDYVIYEYACHEGNIQTRTFITGTSTNPRLVAERERKWQAKAAQEPGEGGGARESGD